MLSSLIAERYAKALLRAAQAENALEPVGAQAHGLRQALAQAEGAERFLTDPLAEAGEKLGILDHAFEGGAHPLFKSFLRAVLEQKRERFLPEVLDAFVAMLDEAEGRVLVSMGTARNLPSAEREVLEKALSQRLGRSVQLQPYTDKSLLGGATLRIGDTLFDASMQGRLNRLKRVLTEGPPPRPKRAPTNSAAGAVQKKAEGKPAKPGAASTKASTGKRKAPPSKKKVTTVKKKAAGKAPAKKKAAAKKKVAKKR